jgi:hypothetical protein
MTKEKLVGSFGGCSGRVGWEAWDAPGELAGASPVSPEQSRQIPRGFAPHIKATNREPSDYPNLAVLVEIKRENQPLSG